MTNRIAFFQRQAFHLPRQLLKQRAANKDGTEGGTETEAEETTDAAEETASETTETNESEAEA